MPSIQTGSCTLQTHDLLCQPKAAAQLQPSRLAMWGAAAGLSMALMGCSVLPKPQAAPLQYDFGSASQQASASAANQSRQVLEQRPLFVPAVTARGLPANTQVMLYRLNYAEDMQLRGYQQSRWSQPVEQLVGLQLRNQIALHRPVLSDGLNVNFSRAAGPSAPAVLYVNLVRFEQSFSTPSASDGLLQAEVTLVEPTSQGDRLLGQKVFDYRVAAEPADAVGAARALAQASQQFTVDVDGWVSQLIAQSAKEQP